MAFIKRLSTIANSTNTLALSGGLELCCGDGSGTKQNHYQVTVADSTAVDATHINLTVPGGSATSVAFSGSVDWGSAANDESLRNEIEDAIVAQGFIHIDGGIKLERSGNALTITIMSVELTLNWIGVPTTAEEAFTEYAPY